MPVVIVGADTQLGAAIVDALSPRSSELRVFVSDPDIGETFRGRTKVAVGDVSDGSHVGGAAMGAFCVIVVAAAASDARERAFAEGPEAVFAQWADGLRDAGVARVIVVGDPASIPRPNALEAIGEYLFVDTTGKGLAAIQEQVREFESRD